MSFAPFKYLGIILLGKVETSNSLTIKSVLCQNKETSLKLTIAGRNK